MCVSRESIDTWNGSIVIIIIVNKMVVINVCSALNYLAATQLEEGDIRKRR